MCATHRLHQHTTLGGAHRHRSVLEGQGAPCHRQPPAQGGLAGEDRLAFELPALLDLVDLKWTNTIIVHRGQPRHLWQWHVVWRPSSRSILHNMVFFDHWWTRGDSDQPSTVSRILSTSRSARRPLPARPIPGFSRWPTLPTPPYANLRLGRDGAAERCRNWLLLLRSVFPSLPILRRPGSY